MVGDQTLRSIGTAWRSSVGSAQVGHSCGGRVGGVRGEEFLIFLRSSSGWARRRVADGGEKVPQRRTRWRERRRGRGDGPLSPLIVKKFSEHYGPPKWTAPARRCNSASDFPSGGTGEGLRGRGEEEVVGGPPALKHPTRTFWIRSLCLLVLFSLSSSAVSFLSSAPKAQSG